VAVAFAVERTPMRMAMNVAVPTTRLPRGRLKSIAAELVECVEAAAVVAGT
jgi:hypothetical protein